MPAGVAGAGSRPPQPLGRWHPLEFVLALAVCAFTAAGHDSPSAIADWAAGCSQETLRALGGRRDPLTGQVRPPCERTFRRVFIKADDGAVNDAVHGYLAAVPAGQPGRLPEATRHEREQRRAAAQPRKPPVPRPAAAGRHGRQGRPRRHPPRRQPGPPAVRLPRRRGPHPGPAGSRRQDQRDPRARPALEGLDLNGMVITLDALHAQQDAARLITEDHHAHYLMFVKANQPTLLAQVTAALSGTDAQFAGASWSEEGKGHGRRERRSIRTAPATGIGWSQAAQVMRIRRDTGPTRGHWATKEIAYAITSLPAGLAGPRHLATHARLHWTVENREHYVRDVTFREDAQKARTGNQPKPRRHPQPRHRRIPQGRIRQHRPRPPLPRPRRPANPRPLRIRLNRRRGHQVTDTPGPWPGWRG